MNVRANGKNIDWKRVAGIAVVLLIVGYQYGRPTLEKWFQRDLPSLNNESDNAGHENASNGASGKSDSRYEAQLPSSKSGSAQASNGDGNRAQSSSQSGEYLRSTGRNQFVSPEGLLYTMGPRGEHRVDHVMRHGKDMPNRPVHSVFEGSKNDILAVIDEAYSLVKSDSPRVKSSNSRGNDDYTINMQRKVGYEGGQKGKRKGYPALSSVKLILDGNRVITAYPYR